MRRIVLLGLMWGLASSCSTLPTPSIAPTSVNVPPVERDGIVLPSIVEPEVTIEVFLGEDPEGMETPLEAAILDRAMRCSQGNAAKYDREMLLQILRLEEQYHVPPVMRGMSLAAACHESGFNPGSEGDHKFSSTGRPLAIGLFQQWPWWERSYHINRREPLEAAKAWIAHVAKQVPKIRRLCRLDDPSDVEDIWRVAWVTAVRAPSKTPRCRQAPTHWTRFQRWRPSWKGLLGERVSANP